MENSDNSFCSLLFMKIIEAKYKNSFKDGEIHFSTPKSWIDYQNNGRGDRFEGTYANPMKYSKKVKTKLALFDDSYKEEGLDNENRIYLKRKSSVEKYCFCFYNLNDSLFEEESIKRNVTEKSYETDVAAYIKENFFVDFCDNMDSKYTVFLLDPEKFHNKLINSIEKLQVKRKNILSQDIKYVDLRKRFEIKKNENELFFKDFLFSHQNEHRVIINSIDKEILNKLKSMNGNIKIDRFNECILGQIDLDKIPSKGWRIKGIGEFYDNDTNNSNISK